MATSDSEKTEPIKEPQKEVKVETSSSSAPAKTEPKKQNKKTEVKPVYPKYPGHSCSVCGSKRVTDDSGKYICPVFPKPSDCPVK